MSAIKHNYKLIIAIFFISQGLFAQIDFNQTKPNDDLGNVSDAYQEAFYDALMQKGIENYSKAITSLKKCIQLNNKAAVLYFELGKNHIALKQYIRAEEALKTAISKDQKNEWYKDALYSVYILQKDYTNAIKTMELLIEQSPKYKEDLVPLLVHVKEYDKALLVLDELDKEIGLTAKRDRLRNRIYNLSGKHDEQIKNLEARKVKNPKKEVNYLQLIYKYSELKQVDKAYNTALELLKAKPNSKLVHLALYKFYLSKNESEKAVASMKIVLQSNAIDPNSKTKVLKDFVSFVGNHPEYESVLVEFTTGETTDRLDGKSNVEIGDYYTLKKQYPKALNYYTKAYKMDSNNFIVLQKLIKANIAVSDFKVAESISDNAIEVYPAQSVLYLLNGQSLQGLNRYKESVDTLEIGLDYIIEDPNLELKFYKALLKAHTVLKNTKAVKSYKSKIEKLN